MSSLRYEALMFAARAVGRGGTRNPSALAGHQRTHSHADRGRQALEGSRFAGQRDDQDTSRSEIDRTVSLARTVRRAIRSVYADLDEVELDGGRTDCRFSMSLSHVSGVRSRVPASKLNHLEDRELRAYGSAGSYMAHGTDLQAQARFASRRGRKLGLRGSGPLGHPEHRRRFGACAL